MTKAGAASAFAMVSVRVWPFPTKSLGLPFSSGGDSEFGDAFPWLRFPECVVTALSAPNLSSAFKDLFLTSQLSLSPTWSLTSMGSGCIHGFGSSSCAERDSCGADLLPWFGRAGM